MDKTILFICTGNYYRSRFAEMLFNAYASRLQLSWRAVSRGFAPSDENVGPIYVRTLERLKTLDVHVEANIRMPIRLEKSDLEEADLIIVLDRTEHEPLMAQLFADCADRIVYWNISDLHLAKAEDAFLKMEKEVAALIESLQDRGTPE